MTEREIGLIQNSWWGIQSYKEEVFDLFYTGLFAINPELRNLFPDSMEKQVLMFSSIIDVMINGIGHLDTLEPKLNNLGKMHNKLGIKQEHFKDMEEALIYSIKFSIFRSIIV